MENQITMKFHGINLEFDKVKPLKTIYFFTEIPRLQHFPGAFNRKMNFILNKNRARIAFENRKLSVTNKRMEK